MRKNTVQSFTLIEALVVVLIIVTLTGVSITLLNAGEYLKQSRDARRVTDLLNTQTAIIAALASNEIRLTPTTNCTSCTSLVNNVAIDGTGWVQFDNTSGLGLRNFIRALPIDPINAGDDYFSYYSDGKTFELNVQMESKKYGEYEIIDGGNDDNIYERGLNLELK